MYSIEIARRLGSPWCVWADISGNAVQNVLAIPTTANRIGQGIQGGQRYLNADRIVVLGFFYNFAAGAGNGFDIVQIDQAVSPGGGTNLVIYGDRATAAITRCEQSVPECFIPLHGGTASPSLTSGAKLATVTTATGPTTGRLVIWGVHLSETDFLLANGYRGSPFDANTANPA